MHTIAAIMLQKNEDGHEQPIFFFSKSLQGSELKYDIMEKQAFALVKAVKAFRPYIVGAKVVAYVPHAAAKDILTQSGVTGKRCKWINKIQEFDLEIQITKLVRGHGLTKLMADINIEANQICNIEEEDVIASIEHTQWYTYIMYYLKYMKCLEGMSDT